jgi:hypothetical protein
MYKLESLFKFIPFKVYIREIVPKSNKIWIYFNFIYNFIFFALFPYVNHSADLLYSLEINLILIRFYITERLFYYHDSIHWEGLIINNCLSRFQISNITLQLSISQL